MAGRVFIVEEPRAGIDVSTAQRFGQVIPIFSVNCRRPSVFRPNQYREALAEALEALFFDPEKDFFLLAGAVVTVSVALSSIAMKWGHVQILIFNAQESRYVLGDLGEPPKEIEDANRRTSSDRGAAAN